MKTLIIIREREYSWLLHVFPEVHPLLLPVCNKPFIEFFIDLSILSGCEAIRLVSDGSLRDVEHYCKNGSRWGVPVSYASIQSNDDLQTILEKNRRYCAEDRILIITGFIFIRYDKHIDYKALFASLPPGEILACSGGSLILTGSHTETENTEAEISLSLTSIDSVGIFYRLCTDILRSSSSNYVLPGYSNEADCHIGRNVVISKSAEIQKPVIIGNNVQILGGTVLGPLAIIGSNIIIDRESTVKGSVVLDNTYIGERLDVENRIASGNVLIEPESGISVTMEDPHLLNEIKKTGAKGTFLRFIIHAFTALILISVLFIPFLLLLPILKLKGKWITKTINCYTSSPGKTMQLKTASIEWKGAPGIVASALSLDRFPMLFRVLNGEFAIIGNHPVTVKPGSHDALNLIKSYRPGVFSYSETEDWPSDGGEMAIVERYYTAHSNPFRDIGLTMKAFLNRHNEKNAQ